MCGNCDFDIHADADISKQHHVREPLSAWVYESEDVASASEVVSEATGLGALGCGLFEPTPYD